MSFGCCFLSVIAIVVVNTIVQYMPLIFFMEAEKSVGDVNVTFLNLSLGGFCRSPSKFIESIHKLSFISFLDGPTSIVYETWSISYYTGSIAIVLDIFKANLII